MSHFSVTVISPNRLDQDALTRILAPWHEFECTGLDDQYVVDVDDTEDLRRQYEGETLSRLKAPDGELHCPYDDRFYRDPTAEEQRRIGPMAGSGCGGGISWHSRDSGDDRGYRAKVRFVPDGYIEVEVPALHEQSFREWLEGYTGRPVLQHGEPLDLTKTHKYGHIRLDAGGQVASAIDRTNPNKQWDWWVIGGRWGGFYKLKPHAADEMGQAGLGGRKNEEPGHADVVQLRDIDIDAMRAAEEAKALATYDTRIAVVAGRPFPLWSEVCDAAPIAEARDLFWGHPVIKDLRAADFWVSTDDIAELRLDRDEIARRARGKALSTFAVVKDGEWHERGSMGWWGCVSDEKGRDSWDREFAALLDGLDPATWVAVVDCHI